MKAYSFLNTVVVISAAPLVPKHEVTNWADGDDALMIARREDAATDKVGADGRMAVAMSANKSGEITLKLLQTSPTNKVLNSIHNLQGGGPAKFIPMGIIFQDTYRQDRAVGTAGYIKKMTEVTRGAGINTQEWVIVVERLDFLLGDPAFTGFATVAAEAQ